MKNNTYKHDTLREREREDYNTSSKIKIVNISPLQHFNGTSGFFINTTKAFLKNNCTVVAIFSSLNTRITKELNNINDKNLRTITISKNKFIMFFQVLIYLIKYRPNFVLIHDLNSSLFLLTKILGIKLCCSIFGGAETKLNKFKRFLIDLILPAKNHQIKSIKERYPKTKMLYFPYCVNFEDSKINKEKQSKFTIGCLGYMYELKGFRQLILACDILKNEKHIDFQLLIGGDGNIKKELENLVEEKNLSNTCKFIGLVNDKNNFYNKLDLFCFPSFKEDIGLVITEAISYKVPIVANNIGFVSDALDENDLLIVPSENLKNVEKLYKKGKFAKSWFELNDNYRIQTEPLNPVILANKIEFAINNHDKMIKKAENAYEKVKSNCSIDNSVKKLLEKFS